MSINWIEAIKRYEPHNEKEVKDKEFILDAICKFDDLLYRDNNMMHMTVSGYTVNKEHDKVLMIYHKIYDSWSWTGGHADGDDNFLHVAIKEAKEETGIEHIVPVSEDIFSLEVIGVQGHMKRGKYVSAHIHLNITYLLEADEGDILTVNEDETNGVCWILIDEIGKYCTEHHMLENIYGKLNDKIRALKI